MAYLSPNQHLGAGFLETISRPDVMDQALLYMAPWHWKQKKSEEKKVYKREREIRQDEEQSKASAWWRQQETERREADRRLRASGEVRRYMREINTLGASMGDALGEAVRNQHQFNMSPKITSTAERIQEAALTLAINLPGLTQGMDAAAIEVVAGQLLQAKEVMAQLASQAFSLLEQVRGMRRG